MNSTETLAGNPSGKNMQKQASLNHHFVWQFGNGMSAGMPLWLPGLTSPREAGGIRRAASTEGDVLECVKSPDSFILSQIRDTYGHIRSTTTSHRCLWFSDIFSMPSDFGGDLGRGNQTHLITTAKLFLNSNLRLFRVRFGQELYIIYLECHSNSQQA